MMLRCANLSAASARGPLVHDVSFSLARGQTLAVVGPSGSGKSLTGRALLALAPPGIVYGGDVLFGGEPLLKMSDKALSALRGRRIAAVFQEPATALNPVMRIGRQIAEPLRIHTDATARERAARVAALLEATGLAAAGVTPDRFAHELSGGQRQRVAIAIALALKPELVVADEPTSALDALAAKDILDLMFRLTGDAGAALVLITHDIHVAQRAERILVMQEGRICEAGGARSVLRAPQSQVAKALVRGATIRLPPRVAASGPAVLEGRAICVTRGGRTVVQDAHFVVRAGERLAVVGGSGSGKTSLARSLVGLLPARGTVHLDGVRVAPDAAELRRTVKMVFQDPVTSFNPRHSVFRIVAEPLHGLGLPKAVRVARAEAILSRVGLPDVLTRKPHAFSGGQRQRIAIARALISQPRVLIADEAVSALDAALRAEIIRLLDDLTRENGIALIFIAHDLGLVRRLADRVIVMAHGQIIEEGETEGLFKAPRAPETKALLAAAEGLDLLNRPATAAPSRAS